MQARYAAVQARGQLSGDDAHQAARDGIAGGATALPHGDRIQQAFGQHDVSAVQAHVGGAADQACDDLGASAYATGTHVAFRGTPDLHTAAHEAAHVVQQRAGVQLKEGLGHAGDRYEKHADAVADAVVAGRSAEGLLGTPAGQSSGAGAAVQRHEYPDTITTASGQILSNEDVNAQLAALIPRAPQAADLYDSLREMASEEKLIQLLGAQPRYKNKSADDIATAAGQELGKFAEPLEVVRTFAEEVESAQQGRIFAGEIRAAVGVYKTLVDKVALGAPPSNVAISVAKVIVTGRSRRATQINVTGATPRPEELPENPAVDEHMADIEARFDVLARKSAAPPPEAKDAIHAVDLAFLEDMRGIPDVYASIKEGKVQRDRGADGTGESVYAVGYEGAINFEGELSSGGGARYHGVLFPKGWIDTHGLDLRKTLDDPKQKKQPSAEDFASGQYQDEGRPINVAPNKAFTVRSESSTAEKGQVGIPFTWNNMVVDGQQTSLLEFCRASSLGVVEFGEDGTVIHWRMW